MGEAPWQRAYTYALEILQQLSALASKTASVVAETMSRRRLQRQHRRDHRRHRHQRRLPLHLRRRVRLRHRCLVVQEAPWQRAYTYAQEILQQLSALASKTASVDAETMSSYEDRCREECTVFLSPYAFVMAYRRV